MSAIEQCGTNCACDLSYDPVTFSNGHTYINQCLATFAGASGCGGLCACDDSRRDRIGRIRSDGRLPRRGVRGAETRRVDRRLRLGDRGLRRVDRRSRRLRQQQREEQRQRRAHEEHSRDDDDAGLRHGTRHRSPNPPRETLSCSSPRGPTSGRPDAALYARLHHLVKREPLGALADGGGRVDQPGAVGVGEPDRVVLVDVAESGRARRAVERRRGVVRVVRAHEVDRRAVGRVRQPP